MTIMHRLMLYIKYQIPNTIIYDDEYIIKYSFVVFIINDIYIHLT